MNFHLSLFIFIGTLALQVFIASAFGINQPPPPPTQFINSRVSNAVIKQQPTQFYAQQQSNPMQDYILVWLMSPEASPTPMSNLKLANPEQVEKALQNPNTVFLDARTDNEIIQDGFISIMGHRWVHASCTKDDCPLLIKTAESQLPDKSGRFSPKDVYLTLCTFLTTTPHSLVVVCLLAPVVVYCGTGMRAAQAQKTLEQKGYSNVLNAGAYADLGYLKNRG